MEVKIGAYPPRQEGGCFAPGTHARNDVQFDFVIMRWIVFDASEGSGGSGQRVSLVLQ